MVRMADSCSISTDSVFDLSTLSSEDSDLQV